MHDVFISYSSKEISDAETIRNVLEQNGIPCWMAPRDIPGGSNYSHEIPIAIRNCQVFVLLLSQNAQSSHWVLKELDMAVNCGKVIIPFMLEDCHLNDEFNFLLSGAQRYSAYQKKTDAMQKLINRVKALTGRQNAESQEEDEEKAAPPEMEAPPKIIDDIPSQDDSKSNDSIPCCPACGGSNLKYLPRAGKRIGAEYWTIILAPLFAILVSFIFLCIAAILGFSFEAAVIILIIGIVLGSILGSQIGKKWIQNHRIRKHQIIRVFRCRSCSKKFVIVFSSDNKKDSQEKPL